MIKKVHKHGIKFDSRLELYFYELLKEEGIPFTFQNTYTLHPSFRYNKAMVRAMTLTVDFDFTTSGIDFIVDTKGFQRNDNKLKWKLFKYAMHQSGRYPQIHLPKNQKECREVVDIIKNVCNLASKPTPDVRSSSKINPGRVRSSKAVKKKAQGPRGGVRRKRNTN